jgi:hypothetical protein
MWALCLAGCVPERCSVHVAECCFFLGSCSRQRYPFLLYCTVMAVLVAELTDSATQFQLSLFVPDFTVGSTLLSSSNSLTLEPSTLDLSISHMLFLIARLSGSRSLGLARLQTSKPISSRSSILNSYIFWFRH